MMEQFAGLEYPTVERTKRHKLLDILTITICGIICGADSWVDIELFGNSKEERFKTFLELPSGIPSHDTFGDVIARLDAQQFWERFLAWVKAVSVLTRGQVIANITVYRETLRHGQSLGKTAIPMVSAWASENRLVSAKPRWRRSPTRLPPFRNC